MTLCRCSILTLAPYRILPAKSGGQQTITQFHHYAGKLCPDHVVSTVANSDASAYHFELHRVFSNSAVRYIPFLSYGEVVSLAKKYDCTHIICEHPYMAPLAMLVARKLNIAWYMRSHNIEAIRFKEIGKKWWRGLYHFERLAMRNANGIFFITPEDKDWAVQHYGLSAGKCHYIPSGTPFKERPKEQPGVKQKLAERLYVEADRPWLYFLGALDYAPNIQAVELILDEVIPRLDKTGESYQILIGGKSLPEELQMRIAGTDNIQYTGFIEDLEQFIKACDVMLNPMMMGGGVKTKAIEALAYNKHVVSTANGATGIRPEICGGNLHISGDGDWDGFCNNVLQVMHTKPDIAATFYQEYYWGNIAEKVLGILRKG